MIKKRIVKGDKAVKVPVAKALDIHKDTLAVTLVEVGVKGACIEQYFLVRSLLNDLGLNSNKWILRLEKDSCPYDTIKVVPTGESNRALIAMRLRDLREFITDIKNTDVLSSTQKEALSILSKVYTINKLAHTLSDASGTAQAQLLLDFNAESNVKESIYEEVATQSKTSRIFKKIIRASLVENDRLHKAFVALASKLPYWSFRDAANILKVRETDLIDTLLKENLIIRDGAKLIPSNSSLAERFFMETTPSSNAKLNPEMEYYLRGILERNGVQQRTLVVPE